jgi:hypothetical protein
VGATVEWGTEGVESGREREKRSKERTRVKRGEERE